MLSRALRIRDAVRVRPDEQRSDLPWPKGCPRYRLVEEPAEVGTIVALATAADFWPDAEDRDVVGHVQVAAVLWDDLASQIADDAGDGMPEVPTWLIPVDALEPADEPGHHAQRADAAEAELARLRDLVRAAFIEGLDQPPRVRGDDVGAAWLASLAHAEATKPR